MAVPLPPGSTLRAVTDIRHVRPPTPAALNASSGEQKGPLPMTTPSIIEKLNAGADKSPTLANALRAENASVARLLAQIGVTELPVTIGALDEKLSKTNLEPVGRMEIKSALRLRGLLVK